MSVLTRVGPVRTLIGFALGAVLLMVIAPAALSDFRLGLLGQYLCYALVGVGIGLAWGRGGMLTLGQGVFFGLGGYAMAMHLTLAQTDPGELPTFMVGSRETLPLVWRPFASAWFAVPATVLLPMLLAFLLGSLVFRRRVRGPYFAILSQALAAAMAILLVGQADITGGTNGLTGITSWFGYDLDDPVNQTTVYLVAAACLLVTVAIARQLIQSRYGELLVAVRDSEERVRFLGYDPASVKIAAYTVAAGMAGLGGALFVSVVQFITPSQVGIVFSIEFVIGVAVGGRATLLGPVVGVVAVGWARSNLSDHFPSGWTYFQGGLFVLVVAFLPGGLASILPMAKARLAERRGSPDDPPANPVPPVEGTDAGTPESAQEVNAWTDQIFAGLEIRDLRVVFDGFVAVGGVDLTVPRGDVRFLIGPNGAGKTTIVDAITGLAKATGSALFGEQQLLGRKVHEIARLGIGRSFQTSTVFEELTVLQNLDIAAGASRGLLTMLRRRHGVPESIEQALETIGLTEHVGKLAGSLAHGQKQWLEIGMLLVQDVQLLLLDEPVAGMSQDERDATGELLGVIARDRTVVIVEHDMDFLRKFARTVTVLHQGKVLSEGTVAQVQADPKVQEVYLGQAATAEAMAAGSAEPAEPAEPAGAAVERSEEPV